jgi:predicted DNA-binding WGR domain protein
MKRYFEYSGADAENESGVASKFWEITVDGKSVQVRFGKIGVNGQTTEKSFDTTAEADAHAAKIIAEKTKKGYLEK